MTEPKKPKPDADLNRIDQALADIERHRQEIQTASSAGAGASNRQYHGAILPEGRCTGAKTRELMAMWGAYCTTPSAGDNVIQLRR
jgi:hypothetical protein